jgi:hypothetical protein
VSKLDAEHFYSHADEAPQQGDILLGAVARVIAEDAFSPARWVMLDEHRATLAPAEQVGPVKVPALRVAAGRGFVMVCSHDCGLDKEFNAVVDELTDPDGDHPLAEREALAQAEGRTDLDRNFTVSPLVRPDKVLVAGEPVDQGLLMGGHIIGYLPVPALVVEGMEIIPESVVDLSYRTTLDRLAYTQRITCVSEAARERLRFALARLDVLRTPSHALMGRWVAGDFLNRGFGFDEAGFHDVDPSHWLAGPKPVVRGVILRHDGGNLALPELVEHELGLP